MPYNSDLKRKNEMPSMKNTVLILAGFAIVFAIAAILHINRENKLKNSRKSVATFIRITSPHGASIKFMANGKFIVATLLHGDYSMYHIGDSILIKYAVEDPELVQVIDP